MIKERLKEMMQADVDKVDIHIDFDESAIANVKIQLKGIPEHFEYSFEDTSVHSMKINKLDEQLEELGSSLVTRINKMCKVQGLVDSEQAQRLAESWKDWLMDNLVIVKDAEVYINGKLIGKCINLNKEFYDAQQLLFTYIEIEGDYKLDLPDEPVRITITGRYGRIFQDINGYMTEVRKINNNNIVITIKQELI
jgi:hypothetical protein